LGTFDYALIPSELGSPLAHPVQSRTIDLNHALGKDPGATPVLKHGPRSLTYLRALRFYEGKVRFAPDINTPSRERFRPVAVVRNESKSVTLTRSRLFEPRRRVDRLWTSGFGRPIAESVVGRLEPEKPRSMPG